MQRFAIFFPIKIEMHRTYVRIRGNRPNFGLRNIVPLVLIELVEKDVADVLEVALYGLVWSGLNELRDELCGEEAPG